MNGSWLYRSDAAWLAFGLAVAMIGSAWCGAWLARRRRSVGQAAEGLASIEAALFGLLGLMLAFTFAAAASRADLRRDRTVEAANAISTAISRADLYPAVERAGFRDEFREYVDARIAFQRAGLQSAALEQAVGRTIAAERRLWRRVTRLAADPRHSTRTLLMVPALNQMFDAATSRLAAHRSRVPDLVLWVLFVLANASAYASGYGTASRGQPVLWAHAVLALLTGLVVFAVLDLDRPNRGLVRLTTEHRMLEDVRARLDEP